MFRAKTPEQQAADEAARAAKETGRAAKEAAREQREFDATPIGRARLAHTRGDVLFQVDLNLAAQQAWLIPTQGVGTFRNTTDPNEILNGVAGEGWDLVTAGFPFLEEGSMSRDKFFASGQQISVKGSVVGFYVFRRREA